MTGWADGPMGAYDLETTGVDVETARIVTACVATVGDGDTRAATWLADPGVEIPAEATAIHGITTAHAREHGQPADGVSSGVEQRLIAAWAAGLPVVGFNVAYDLTVLDRELRRHHGRPLAIEGPVVDPLVIDRHYDRYRRGSRKLDAMCAHYGVPLDGAHDAETDAVAAARLAWRQARMYPHLAGWGLAELTAAQASWHAEWAAEFRRYLTARGRTDDLPDGAWPLRRPAHDPAYVDGDPFGELDGQSIPGSLNENGIQQ
jgi:DNA polymerase-3 subunit epsilon